MLPVVPQCHTKELTVHPDRPSPLTPTSLDLLFPLFRTRPSTSHCKRNHFPRSKSSETKDSQRDPRSQKERKAEYHFIICRLPPTLKGKREAERTGQPHHTIQHNTSHTRTNKQPCHTITSSPTQTQPLLH